MGFEVKFFGKSLLSVESRSRSIENPSVSLTDEAAISELLGISPNYATHETALNFAAVYRAVVLISSSIAGLPFHLYKRTDKGREVDHQSPLNSLVNYEPNSLFNSFEFRERQLWYLLLWGDFFAIKVRDVLNNVVALEIVHPRDVRVIKSGNQLWYRITGNETLFSYSEILHIKGPGPGERGLDPVSIARNSLSGALSAQELANQFFKKGHFNDRYVKATSITNDTQRKQFEESFNRAYSGLKNAGMVPVLYNAELLDIGMKPENMEFLSTRKFQITEISRWFGVQPHKLFDLQQSTNNNIEQQSIEFVQDSLLPWCNRIESEYNRKLIPNMDRGSKYFEHNIRALLRGDLKTQGEYYKAATGGRPWLTPDEIRELENMNTLGGKSSELIDPANIVGKPTESRSLINRNKR